MKKNRIFNLRSFTSFSLVISTLIMSWSGFVLYVAPPGRIANWGTWKLMLFTKTDWQALHTIFSYLFFILVFIHLFFVNWSAFLTYFKSRMKAGLNRKWELASALLLSGLIFTGTLYSWKPFGPVMTFGEKVKGSWESKIDTPPVLHMEIYNLIKLAAEFDSVPPVELVKTLQDRNIKVSGTEETLKEIASVNNTTPSAIYNILTSVYKRVTIQKTDQVPEGIGKFTLSVTAQKSGKDLESLIGLLKTKGIDADGNTSLRTIAEKLDLSPRDVYKFLTE